MKRRCSGQVGQIGFPDLAAESKKPRISRMTRISGQCSLLFGVGAPVCRTFGLVGGWAASRGFASTARESVGRPADRNRSGKAFYHQPPSESIASRCRTCGCIRVNSAMAVQSRDTLPCHDTERVPAPPQQGSAERHALCGPSAVPDFRRDENNWERDEMMAHLQSDPARNHLPFERFDHVGPIIGFVEGSPGRVDGKPMGSACASGSRHRISK